jgi:hypothetical protein
MLHCNQTKELT